MLEIKLLRELARQRGQIASIAVVLASGIASFLMLRGTVDRLATTRDLYYDRYRFAHVFADLERAPESLARRVEALPGVRAVQTRIAQAVQLPLEGSLKPAFARVLSLPNAAPPATNALHLDRGRFPAPGRDDEVVVVASFAAAQRLEPGSHLPAILNAKLRRLRVVGIARSPEFVYVTRPGALIADPKRCAVLWMDRAALASAFDLEGNFNELSLRLQPGASERAVRARLDRILKPYGGDGSYGREQQLSNRILNGELDQLAGIAGLVPLVFLGVAVFLIRLVLGRMITLQRTEIAVLKAAGYTNREIGRHYLGLVAVVTLPGALLGVLGGRWLGGIVLGMYAANFQLPNLRFTLSAPLIVLAVSASALAAAGAALWAVRAAVRLPPAEAMRPPTPPRYRAGWMERLHLGALAGAGGMMVLREIQRRPLRTVMTALGMAAAVALMVLGRFGRDSLDYHLEHHLLREHQQDLSVLFSDPLPLRAARAIARLPGVVTAEPMRAVPVRAWHQHHSRDVVWIGLPRGGELRRLIERSGREVPLPEHGIVITQKLGEVLGVRPGERLELEVRQGERAVVRPQIHGFVDEATGLQIYARSSEIARLQGDSGAVSGVLLRIDPRYHAEILAELKRLPRVLSVSELTEEVSRQRVQQRRVIQVWTMVSSLLAAAVIFGVVYNNARIALAARARDLASLRVLGFTRREISGVLLGGLVFELALALPAGLWFGKLWARQFLAGVNQEQFRSPAMVSATTYALAAGVTLLAAAASAFWVRRGLDRLDLIAVLKTRE